MVGEDYRAAIGRCGLGGRLLSARRRHIPVHRHWPDHGLVEDEVVFPDFTPSARSMAFRRDRSAGGGGFPESEQFAEDTAFGEALASAGHQAVFVPEAVVEWRPPTGLVSQARTLFFWGRGDGHLGLRSINYRHLLPRFLGAGALALAAIVYPLLLLVAPLPLAPMVYRKSREQVPAHGRLGQVAARSRSRSQRPGLLAPRLHHRLRGAEIGAMDGGTARSGSRGTADPDSLGDRDT